MTAWKNILLYTKRMKSEDHSLSVYYTSLPILRRIQRPTTQGHSSHAKYENSRKIETYRNNHFQRIH